MIDKTGISTGKDARSIAEKIENDLYLNYKKYFTQQKDKPINEIDLFEWEQTQRLRFNKFKEDNFKIIQRHKKDLAKSIISDLQEAYKFGIDNTQKKLKAAEKKGIDVKYGLLAVALYNNDKTKSLVREINDKVNTTLNNSLRYLNDRYIITLETTKQFVNNSNTLYEAIEKANKPLIDIGLVGGTTSKGANMQMTNLIESYTVETSQDMMFQGAADKRTQAGQFLVYTTVHASSCEYCTRWQGMILIDDVFQPGRPDGRHELLSDAVADNFLHYGCRHNLITYIEGFDLPPAPENVPPTTRQQHALYHKEQRQRQIERYIREYKRRETLAMTEVQRVRASNKVRQWQAAQRNLINSTDGLYRQYWKENPNWRMPRDNRYSQIR